MPGNSRYGPYGAEGNGPQGKPDPGKSRGQEERIDVINEGQNAQGKTGETQPGEQASPHSDAVDQNASRKSGQGGSKIEG